MRYSILKSKVGFYKAKGQKQLAQPSLTTPRPVTPAKPVDHTTSPRQGREKAENERCWAITLATRRRGPGATTGEIQRPVLVAKVRGDGPNQQIQEHGL